MTTELGMRHTLITGGAGLIGSHLAEALLARGDRVLGPTTKSRWSYAESKAIDEFLLRADPAGYDRRAECLVL